MFFGRSTVVIGGWGLWVVESPPMELQTRKAKVGGKFDKVCKSCYDTFTCIEPRFDTFPLSNEYVSVSTFPC